MIELFDTTWSGADLQARTCHDCLPNAPYRCTRDKGHDGEHVAHGLDGLALVVWRR